MKSSQVASGFLGASLLGGATPPFRKRNRKRRHGSASPRACFFPSTAPAKKKAPSQMAWCFLFGRGRRTRTHDPWFWRPVLYQLSYTPVCISATLNIISYFWVNCKPFFKKTLSFFQKKKFDSRKSRISYIICFKSYFEAAFVLRKLSRLKEITKCRRRV